MKKITALLLAAILCLGLCAVGCDKGSSAGSDGDPTQTGGNHNNNNNDDNNDNNDDNHGNGDEQKPEEPLMEYRKYDLKTYLTPFWEGTVVYNETLWFAGEDDFTAPLMYAPDEIVSVMSYDLTKTYREGVDYVWEKGSKTIRLPEGSSIPHMTYREYYTGAMTSIDGNGLYFAEGSDICSRQVAVTYRHSDTAEWTLPRLERENFPKTFEKLENGESINVVFYGDSITVGANSSDYVDYGPHAESYPEMVRSYMQKRYPAATVNYINTAVGGVDSNWGNDGKMGHELDSMDGGAHFKTRVLDKAPDLLFIAFGMNDGPSDANYKANIKSMIDRVRAEYPEVEIMLVSGMTANFEAAGFYNKDYEKFQQALIELAEAYEGIGVSTVLNTVRSLEGRTLGKRFRDWTGNNVNHPNDFMARVYAQTILYTLFGSDYIKYI